MGLFGSAARLRALSRDDGIPLRSRNSATWRRRLKTIYLTLKRRVIERFRSYGRIELEACLASLGIGSGDAVLLHGSFDAYCGFRGSPRDVADAFLARIGANGHLMMVSLPFRSSAYEYLELGRTFDVRRTISHMGLISEAFRRRDGVLRSFHPTHPVLALGPRAAWIVEGHDDCLFACGPGSPFAKLPALDARIVFFNVSHRTMTFFHYLEHLVSEQLPFRLYDERVFEVPSVRLDGTTAVVRARVASRETIARRRPDILFAELARRGLVQRARVGNTRIIAVRANDAIACTMEMARDGRFFFAPANDPA